MTDSPKALPRHAPVPVHAKVPAPASTGDDSGWHSTGDNGKSPSNSSAIRRNSNSLANLMQGANAETQANSSDSLFFHELLVTGVSDQGSGGQDQGGGQGGHLSPPAMAQLVDELSNHLPGSLGEDFNATVFMPNLGKINIKAQQRQGYWAVELGFDDPEALHRVKNSHGACEDALNQALEHPVELILRQL